MAPARFKDLCIDANDTVLLGQFWADVLGRTFDADADGTDCIVGPTARHTIWVNRVPEPKTVKHRVHLDVYTRSLDQLRALGSAPLDNGPEGVKWTVMTDPEGGEYCAFLRDELPAERLHGLVVDCADPSALARWWADAYGAPVTHHHEGFSTVSEVPGMPILTMDFVRVPEAKTSKNRIHWDVTVEDLEPLVDAGATVLRPRGGDIRWHVMADPEGNEFCAFVEGEGA